MGSRYHRTDHDIHTPHQQLWTCDEEVVSKAHPQPDRVRRAMEVWDRAFEVLNGAQGTLEPVPPNRFGARRKGR